ncbi:MAG: DUF4157 domain-containing protein [Burkholderiales bacterium]|nr:DUF4157 domain-containing protein [Burkholderiales bacterium]
MHTFTKKTKTVQQTAAANFPKRGRLFAGQSREVQAILQRHRMTGDQTVPKSEFNKVSVHADSRFGDVRRFQMNDTVESIAPRLGLQMPTIPVYIDGKARSLTRSYGADGLMISGNIYLNPDTYRPESVAGKAVLTHELAHLAQYRKGGRNNNTFKSAFLQNLSAEFEAREAGKAIRAGTLPRAPRESLASPDSVMAAHTDEEQASLEYFIPQRLSEIGQRAGMSSEEALIQAHDQLFYVMVPTATWRGYDRENVRRASLGGAIFELLARTPWEDFGDYVSEALGGSEASMGLFQAYPQFVARSLTNPAMRQWMWEHGDPVARRFIENLPGRELSGEQRPTMTPYTVPAPQTGPNLAPMGETFIRRRLRGTDSPVTESFYLSLAGKIQHTLFAIMELDRTNPVMRSLPQSQQLRIWMDYETDDVVNEYYATGEFQREHEREPSGAPIDLHNRSSAPQGSAQRHVMAHLGFSVWGESTIPNPP